jgi:hypothetical protein
MVAKDALNVAIMAAKACAVGSQAYLAARPKNRKRAVVPWYYLLVHIAVIPLLAAITLTYVCPDIECSDHSEPPFSKRTHWYWLHSYFYLESSLSSPFSHRLSHIRLQSR